MGTKFPGCKEWTKGSGANFPIKKNPELILFLNKHYWNH